VPTFADSGCDVVIVTDLYCRIIEFLDRPGTLTILKCIPVLYGCETWSLTLREEYRLRVFENRVLRRIFGPKRDDVTREWRKLHNKELHDLYSSPSIIRIIMSRGIRLVGPCSTNGGEEERL
jgi:hypothetical protein